MTSLDEVRIEVRVTEGIDGIIVQTLGPGGFSTWVRRSQAPELYHHLMAQMLAIRTHQQSMDAEKPK